MRNLTESLRLQIANALAHLQSQTESVGFKHGLQRYLSVVEPSLMRYQHHLGHRFHTAELQSRYQYELAMLHVLTSAVAHDLKQRRGCEIRLWPILDSASPYNWYKLPKELAEDANRLCVDLGSADAPALMMSQACAHLLAKDAKTHLGEFYTPLPIAEHLVELSGLKLTDLLVGKSVVDPACGGGIILSVIAAEIAKHAVAGPLSCEELMQCLSDNLFGFDIQPFAVIATRTLLIYSCMPLLNANIPSASESLFPNILLQDALAMRQYWSDPGGFDYIVGNPPFMTAKKALLDYVEDYEEILYGHPNLFQLFLWWAVNAAKPRGIISYLLPQSILAGNYCSRLRHHLDRHTNVLGITRMVEHKGLIGNTDQQMMAVCLEVSRDKRDRKRGVDVRVVRNGDELTASSPYRAKHERVVQEIHEASMIWVVSDNALDYAICERLQAKCVTLSVLDDHLIYGNGEYVWNRNKELTAQERLHGSIPLISAACIRAYGFEFPYTGPHPSHTRQFSAVNEKVEKLIHREPVLLIQRTTPRKLGRRLVAGMPFSKFYGTYGEFFLENHVNYVRAKGGDVELLYGLMGWFNSDIVNFAFQLRNGTAHVSLFELGMLPVSLDLLRELAEPTITVAHSDLRSSEECIRALNRIVFDWVGLKSRQIDRIARALRHDGMSSN